MPSFWAGQSSSAPSWTEPGGAANLEAEDCRALPPEVLFCNLQKRLADAEASYEKGGADLAEAEAKVASFRQQHAQLASEVVGLDAEVLAAQRAVATVAAGSGGVDLAGLATDLCGLQTLLSAAPASVAKGQGVALLESIHAQVLVSGAAFPAASTLGGTPGAPAAAAPAASPAPGGAAAASPAGGAPAEAAVAPAAAPSTPGTAFRPSSAGAAAWGWEGAGLIIGAGAGQFGEKQASPLTTVRHGVSCRE